MAYKTSQFNYFTEISNGDIIIFNTYKGTSSICKLTSSKKDYFINLQNYEKIESDNTELFNNLIDKGFLIDEDCDEEQRLRLLYIKGIGGSTLNLVLLPTEQCNFRCKYCYEDFKRGRMSTETQNAIVKYVKANIHNYRGLNISWFGGEPLMALDIIQSLSKQFIEVCKNHRIPYISNITSNGYLLDAKTFKILYDLKVLNYNITIDGIKETHNQQKPLANGQESFDTVINNMLEIKNSVENRFFKINIRTNFTKEIYSTLEKYVDFFYDKFGNDKRFSFFARPAGDWGGSTVKSFTDNLFEEDTFPRVFEDLLNFERTLNYETHQYLLNPCSCFCIMSNINSFLIDSDANIRKCSCSLDDDRNVIGKLEEDGNMKIDIDEMAKWVDFYNPEGVCKNCFFAPACLNNSCLAQKVLNRGDKNECHVYEKIYLGHILKLMDKTEKIEVLE